MIVLSGKTTLVTGGAGGIGQAIAAAFVQCGARVAVIDKDPEGVAKFRSKFASQEDVLAVVGDVTNSANVRQFIDEVDAKFGRLDVVVNNVGSGLGWRKPFLDTEEVEWDALYHANLRHILLMCKAAVPLMRRSGDSGSIINISTIEAFRAIPVMTVYSAFKTAISGFTRSFALELAPSGIRVNAIAPETTATATFDVAERLWPEHLGQVRNWIPLGRFGRPEDIAGCALFLASDLSSWITGTTINVDGGALAAAGWVRMPNGGWTHRPVVTGSGYRQP